MATRQKAKKPTATKTTKTTKKLPGKFKRLFSTRKGVLIVVFVLVFSVFGSYRLYTSSAASDFKEADTCRYYNITLRRGSTGPCVWTLQSILNGFKAASDPSIARDGKFGPATEAAVKRYQRGRGLTADGVVGKNTWNEIVDECFEYLDWFGRNPLGCPGGLG